MCDIKTHKSQEGHIEPYRNYIQMILCIYERYTRWNYIGPSRWTELHTWYGAWCWKNRDIQNNIVVSIAVGSVSCLQSKYKGRKNYLRRNIVRIILTGRMVNTLAYSPWRSIRHNSIEGVPGMRCKTSEFMVDRQALLVYAVYKSKMSARVGQTLNT